MRKNVIRFLEETIEFLKKEHVDDLMRAGRVEELEEIGLQINFEPLDDYLKGKIVGTLELTLEEIPENSLLEMVFIANRSEYSDWDIFDNWTELQEALLKKKGKLEFIIGSLIEYSNLSDLSLEELLTGEIVEEDDDFDK